MSSQNSAGVSEIILAGTSIWCFSSYPMCNGFRFAHCTFGLIFTHSLIGILKWSNPEYSSKVDKPYETIGNLQKIFALPCISTEVWLMYNYQKEMAFIHIFLSFIPLAQYLRNKINKDILDTIIVINTVSTGIVCYVNQNFYGVAAALTFGINHFLVGDDRELLDLPNTDLHNYGMSFFSFFALNALIK